jgi:hypothetical protein
VAEARARIYGNMLPIFEALQRAEARLSFEQIGAAVVDWKMPVNSIEDCLQALCNTGLVIRICGRDEDPSWCIPQEVLPLLEYCESPSGGTQSPLALFGWLHRYLSTKVPRASVDAAAQNMFQMLGTAASIESRLQSLEAWQLSAVQNIVSEFGGMISKELFGKEYPDLNLFELDKALEKASLGSVMELNLEPFGLRHNAPTLVIVHEAVIFVLEHQKEISDKQIIQKVSVGTDFVANFSRFANYLEKGSLRFTTKGAIYKTTGKRLAAELLMPDSREFTKFEILELEFQFARDTRLLINSAEQKFILSEEGLRFLRNDMLEKQRLMLDWMVEEYSLRGDMSHQVRMRRSALRFLRLLKPKKWYDAMHLPYIVRNHHFSLLTSGQVSPLQNGSFPLRASSDARELCWNLLLWMRKDLHLLGLIDLGYDANDKLIAMRLTSVGCEILGLLDLEEKRQTGHIIVNPDFEIVLFPLLASHRLIYTLDSICDRERTDSLYHFRISQQSVKRALSIGFSHDEILQVLSENSPTPLPQNVCYELRSWTNA